MEKIAFTGTHGTGKTTSCYELAREMKIECPGRSIAVLAENASRSPYPINQDTTPESQLWIFTNQMREELELSARYDILICDRTVVDAIAYTLVAGFEALGQGMMGLAAEHVPSYDRIIIKTGNWWAADGIRDASDVKFRNNVEECLLGLYVTLGVETVRG